MRLIHFLLLSGLLLRLPLLPAVEITSVNPSLVSTAGGTEVTLVGSGFTASMTARIGGQGLDGIIVIDGLHMRGRTKALAAGFHDAEVLGATGGVVASLARAVEAAAPPVIRSVSPQEVLSDGSTRITVSGVNLRDVTVVEVGTHKLVSPVLAAGGASITGFAPALDAGEPLGARDVTASDSRGSSTLRSAVTYVAPQPQVALTSVEPSLVSTAGGTDVTLVGSGFTASMTARIGGQGLDGIIVIDGLHMRGRTRPLAAGFHDAEVLNSAGAVAARLPRAVEAVEIQQGPVVTSVEPRELCAEKRTRITVMGRGFGRETRVRIGSAQLMNARFVDPGTIIGDAPPWSPGAYDVSVSDSSGESLLRTGVSYGDCESMFPGPEEVEATLAEGTARFSWFNPVPYDTIRVMDSQGNFLKTLPGTATFLELPASGQTTYSIQLQGEFAASSSDATDATAMLHQCDRPPPLLWGGAPGKLNFSLRGSHPAASVTRCVAPPPGPDPQCGDPGEGGGAAFPHRLTETPAGHGGLLGLLPGKGFVVAEEFRGDRRLQQGNMLVTGFVLDKPADKLEIGGYYEKLATAFGLSLRGHLIHIFPDDGFEDELTFPDAELNQGKKLNIITYYRADKDIGVPGVLGDDDETNDPAQPCRLQIPVGEYLLELYAVGGDAKIPYYIFADDPHDNEILIQGAPCPPYPLVKVTDVTGLRSLPNVTAITAQVPKFGLGNVLTPCQQGIRVKFTASGQWLDEANCIHDLPGDVSPHFEFSWKIFDVSIPTARVVSGSAYLTTCVRDWGCYKVELTIRDKQCGFEKVHVLEVPVIPNADKIIPCAAPPDPFTFHYPTPDPGGIFAVVGLKDPNPPGGQGFFSGPRPVSFRVLVVPCCYCTCNPPCDTACDMGCPAATLDTLEFRLATRSFLSPNEPPSDYDPLDGVVIDVEDLCPGVTAGAKYFGVKIDDLGAIPSQPFWAQLTCYEVFFQGRIHQSDPNSGWRNVGESKAHPLRLFDRPTALDGSFWSGHFIDGDESYHFVAKSTEETEKKAEIGASDPVDLGLPGSDVGIPSKDNELGSGFTSRFMMQRGVWQPEEGSGTSSGEIMSNQCDGAPVQSMGKGDIIDCSTPGGGSGGIAVTPPTYEWCRREEIISEEFSEQLFNSILYTGTIGPIPVTIWASIGFGLSINVEADVAVFVAPFGALQGQPTVESHFFLLSDINLSIPCEIRADIVGGLASLALRLIPSAKFILDTHVGTRDANIPQLDFAAALTLDIAMEIEACLLFGLACLSFELPILDDYPLLSEEFHAPDASGEKPRCELDGIEMNHDDCLDSPTSCADYGSALRAGDGRGEGGTASLPYMSISAPVTIYSPDRTNLLECAFDEQGLTTIAISDHEVYKSGKAGEFLNAAAAFVSNTAVILAWTSTAYCQESGLPLNRCFPADGDLPPSLEEQNLMNRQQELVITPILRGAQGWDVSPTPIRIADPVTESPDPAARLADGMAAIAADLAALSDDPPGGEAIVAWVRYEDEYLIHDPDHPKKTIYRRYADGLRHPCTGGKGQAKSCGFFAEEVDNIRPQMELTAIYVRRVGLSGPLPGENKLKISPTGINVEPAIALSPSGDVGYCVWVHDPTHKDLIESNKGRSLLYSVYSSALNAWSSPQSVLDPADYDAKYPGVVEPYIALKDEQTGLLAFTAVRSSAAENDTGLGGNGFVYGVRLEGGVFGEPFVIHGRCARRVYGWMPVIDLQLPPLVDPKSQLNFNPPEWVMAFQGTGPAGTREGSGDLMIAAIPHGVDAATAPVALFHDDNVHSNFAVALGNGNLHSMSLNGGERKLQVGLVGGGGARTGRGGGLPPLRFIESRDLRLEPDLAITACRLTDAFPAPGSMVKAAVDVENLGLAGTPVDSKGRSAVQVKAIFIDEEGRERVAAADVVPVLEPMGTAQIALALEMPHDPVRLRVVLDPNPVDADRTNDSRECLFGAPCPLDVRCERDRSVRVTWTNPAIYDEVLLYRSGSMLASLPGACHQFVDIYAPPGEVVYEVRGRMGASKSKRVAGSLSPPGTRFRRGDSNDSGVMDISDSIFTLTYLFLDSRLVPPCLKAADADDSGDVDISDAIFALQGLFLGGPLPPAPGREDCGFDPTADGLSCEVHTSCR